MRLFIARAHIIYYAIYVLVGALLMIDNVELYECAFRAIFMELGALIYSLLSFANPVRNYASKMEGENSLVLWDLSIIGVMLVPIVVLRYFNYNFLLLFLTVFIFHETCGKLFDKHYENYKLTLKK